MVSQVLNRIANLPDKSAATNKKMLVIDQDDDDQIGHDTIPVVPAMLTHTAHFSSAAVKNLGGNSWGILTASVTYVWLKIHRITMKLNYVSAPYIEYDGSYWIYVFEAWTETDSSIKAFIPSHFFKSSEDAIFIWEPSEPYCVRRSELSYAYKQKVGAGGGSANPLLYSAGDGTIDFEVIYEEIPF